MMAFIGIQQVIPKKTQNKTKTGKQHYMPQLEKELNLIEKENSFQKMKNER